MKNLFRPIYRKLYDLYWAISMFSWQFVNKKEHVEVSNTQYSIGITTYLARFEPFFKPLIQQLTTIYPDTQLIIAINGYYDRDKQEHYLAEISSFLSSYSNITSVQFEEPQGLSTLWNQLIIHSSTTKTIILNDDVEILPGFRKEIERKGVVERSVQLINRSWSHFIISKEIISKIGWFDQRFPGIGNEDEDYESRLVLSGLQIESTKIKSINNLVIDSKDFSYGKSIAVVNKKYVKANKDFFDQKWEQSDGPAEGFAYVEILKCYIRLKDGMETPNFYQKDIKDANN